MAKPEAIASEPEKPRPSWPVDRYERRSIESLIPYAQNPNMHSPAQVEQIRRSIESFGWTTPILIDDDGNIIAGHGRVLAAEKLGLKQLPVIIATDWSPERKRLYVIADNQIPRNSEWDVELLKVELTELRDLGVDVSLSGFTEPQLDQYTLETIDDPLGEWNGMPHFTQEDRMAFRTIKVHFRDQKSVDRFAALIAQQLTAKTRFVWYPEAEIEVAADKRYIAPT